jgi:hypothetical protein
MVLVAARHAAPATCTPRDKQTRFSNETKVKEKQNYPGFEFKPRQVNDSSQSNQGTDHLVSHLACFWPADHRVESEPLENFQDINFEDLEHQHAGFEGKCP